MWFRLTCRVAALSASLILSGAIALATAPSPGLDATPGTEVAPGEILIQLSPDAFASLRADQLPLARTGMEDLDRRLADIGAVEIGQALDLSIDAARKSAYGMDRIFRVRYAGGHDPETAASAFAGAGGIVFAEPNRIAHAMLTPNDPYYPAQWAHDNTGQAIKYGGGTVGTPDCDTDSDQAWDLQTGSSSLIIAIIDTGVDLGHAEFSGRLVSGYDFINNDSNPTDDNGHGTCCAGIAAGAGNNAQGIAGVAWGVRIMPVKVLAANGSGSYTAVANGMNFAADNGAKILSMSLGGGASSTLQTAVNYAYGKGCAIFAAAGNGNASSLDYPAAYPNVISIGALSPCNERKSTTSCDGEYWWGSNYGTGLDFMAPGVRIHTADIRGSGGFGSGDYITDFNGTSSATPHAAGIGALVWSQNAALTNASLLSVLQGNCDDMGAAGYDTQTGYGRMNAYLAVLNAGGGGPVEPEIIFSEGFESTTVPGTVWTASDANATSGADYWGDQSTGARIHGGVKSAYCADNSDIPRQKYDNNMNAEMTLINPIGLSGYTDVQLSFWIWYKTTNSLDYLSLQIWNGSTWTEQQRWSGSSSTWRNLTYSVTGPSLQFRFIFYANSSKTSEGAYVDDISVVGTPTAFAPPDGPTILALMDQRGESTAPKDSAQGSDVALVATPNPFNPKTALRFTLESAAHVRLEIFSTDGRRVGLLHDGVLPAGTHELVWRGADEVGHEVASAIYHARLSIEGKPASQQRLLLLK